MLSQNPSTFAYLWYFVHDHLYGPAALLNGDGDVEEKIEDDGYRHFVNYKDK
jgi:hypothetical protein